MLQILAYHPQNRLFFLQSVKLCNINFRLQHWAWGSLFFISLWDFIDQSYKQIMKRFISNKKNLYFQPCSIKKRYWRTSGTKGQQNGANDPSHNMHWFQCDVVIDQCCFCLFTLRPPSLTPSPVPHLGLDLQCSAATSWFLSLCLLLPGLFSTSQLG